jgi:septal ring factor EnvC (AmiA/AmiB activator)
MAARRRLLLGISAALLVGGTAGAYVPSSSLGQLLPGGQTLERQDDGARDFERMLAELEARERGLDEEIRRIGPELETARRRMAARGRAYYRLVRAGLLPVGGGFEALVEHAVRVERLRSALDLDLALAKRLGSRREEAATELKRVRAEKAPLEVQREAMHRARVAMQHAEERRAAFQRAFGASEPPPHFAVYGAGGPDDEAPNDRFAALRGRLSFPLAGRAEVLLPHSADNGQPGVQLLPSRDSAVRGVYAGRVAFTGATEHGQTVLLDHGEGYFSLYGNLSRAEVAVGEAVPERGRIGWVERRGSHGARLYFELRRGQSPLDAAAWLGL